MKRVIAIDAGRSVLRAGWGIGIAVMVIALTACSPSDWGASSEGAKKSEISLVGPSDKKAQLDFDELIQGMFQQMVSISDFEVLKREMPAEDRVNIDVSVTFKSNPDAMRQFEAMARHESKIFSIYKYEPPKILLTARALDGKEMKQRMNYRLKGNGLWVWTNAR